MTETQRHRDRHGQVQTFLQPPPDGNFEDKQSDRSRSKEQTNVKH